MRFARSILTILDIENSKCLIFMNTQPAIASHELGQQSMDPSMCLISRDIGTIFQWMVSRNPSMWPCFAAKKRNF